MWIGNVNVPEELIDAHRRGGLVIFVGAGASMDAPSNLPNFRRLATEIASDAGVNVTPDEPPDVLLGDADGNPLMDVHGRVARRIGDPASLPNKLHEAIGALASTGPKVRIVTTNYDRHLSIVLQDRRPDEYRAPALPMGDDFDGLVYLHGTLSQESRHLVVTDKDFGRAYLRDAWAARFLERMFARYTVLFIGYSHSDVVMTYLARALGPGSRRYVLTSDPLSPQWRRLRIEAVGYEVVDGSHAALTDVVRKWAEQASMGLLDHRQSVAQLLSTPPSNVPEEMSYLESVLADDDKVGFFTEHARSVEWLSWVSTRPRFRQLFEQSPGGGVLAYWFAEHYVLKQERTNAALAVLQAAGGRLGPALWSAIGHTLHARQEDRSEWLSPWVVLLVRDAPESGELWLDYALVASRWPQDRATALLLFDHLTEPKVVLRTSFLPDAPPDFDVRVRGNQFWLPRAWQNVFVPHLGEAAPDIIGLADSHLRKAHRLLTATGAAQPDGDPMSFGLSAIEVHAQDEFREPIYVLVDAARDCLEALLDRRAGSFVLAAWAASDVPLLRRSRLGLSQRCGRHSETRLAT